MTTGERIRAARKKASMTQAELAAKLDIPFQSISQWERDIRKPKYETIKKIAQALEIEPSSLMDLEGCYTTDELIDLYMRGAKTWATDFRFSEDQKIRIGELLAEYALRIKQLINAMADTTQVNGKIPLTPYLQSQLDSLSAWAADSLRYVNNDYSDNP